MARLIDADQYRKEYMDSRTFEPMKILDMQPTIKAVPIQRLEKLKAEVFNACMDSYFMPTKLLSCDEVTELIDKLLEE